MSGPKSNCSVFGSLNSPYSEGLNFSTHEVGIAKVTV